MSVFAAEHCDRCDDSTPRALPDWRCPCCREAGADVFVRLALALPAFVWPGERPAVHLPVHRPD